MTADLIDHAVFVRYLDAYERSALYARARSGALIRIHRGCFVDAHYWNRLDPAAQHRARAQLAAVSFGNELVFSHRTALALWRLPSIEEWPSRPHVAGPPNSGRHATATLARHSLGIDSDAVVIDGLRVTSLATTVVQVAAAHSFTQGVVVGDAALRRVRYPNAATPAVQITTRDLMSAAERIPLHHGGARALAAAKFCDGRADRPGESVSRVTMLAAGIRPPILQATLYGASGARYLVDFYWPHCRLIGEFDGAAKYRDPEFLRGRTPEQALTDEKYREDDLRAADHGMSRWGWRVANSAPLLSAQLRAAGLD